jgi:hypothetical protein
MLEVEKNDDKVNVVGIRGATMRILTTAALLLAISTPASAAESAVGPMNHLCKDVTSSKENAGLTLMWVAGYVSGLNWYNKRDFLEGKAIGDIVDAFSAFCLAEPDKTVRDGAVSVVAKFRMEIAGRLIYEEQQKRKKK